MAGKGQPRTGGRKKGTPNKVTGALKEAILMAAEKAHPEGMVGYLVHQAAENPNAFMSLLGRALPLTVGSDPDNPLQTVHTIRLVDLK